MRLIGVDRDFGEAITAGVVDRDGNLVAGLVFHNFYPESQVIEVTGAAISPRWAQRGVLREVFRYVFERAGCQMAVSRTAVSNGRVRKLWKALGATETIIPRLRGRDEAECIITLTDDGWAASKFME